jgi:hypothetical protein
LNPHRPGEVEQFPGPGQDPVHVAPGIAQEANRAQQEPPITGSGNISEGPNFDAGGPGERMRGCYRPRKSA